MRGEGKSKAALVAHATVVAVVRGLMGLNICSFARDLVFGAVFFAGFGGVFGDFVFRWEADDIHAARRCLFGGVWGLGLTALGDEAADGFLDELAHGVGFFAAEFIHFGEFENGEGDGELGEHFVGYP